ncbi:uncharacterized protein CCOS01_12218 [Colletotrichum costaricense]|uniref:Uncharacterized protein n=1 Tax=Colletotrichum costaricense TaxID=1209916 RepID=A0AAJ0DX18_9PEZI|nr:uncharacterized protein CCOS01_12218 [Colletotrichum costaricense]KAK1517961.1 hypothetical protein CCOS01_12218 [Colletotrichum costaricense]
MLAAHVRYEIARSMAALKLIENSGPPVQIEERVAELVAHVRSSAFQSMTDIISHLALDLPAFTESDGRVKELMRLASSLVSMTQVRTSEISKPADISLPFWETDASLNHTLATGFSVSQNDANCTGVIPPQLTISHLVMHHGYSVNWTSCLHQHLNVSPEHRVISIFQHKIWLSAHSGSESQCFLPATVIDEALDTLNLLFPLHDAGTKSFLDKQRQTFNNLILCRRTLKSNLSDYEHWGKQIQQLVDILDGPPVGFRQFLPRRDRPNLIESANFWIACFVAVLAVISFVFGLIAVVYAKQSVEIANESLELTKLQYLLSIAQACSDPNEARLLPTFCHQHT